MSETLSKFRLQILDARLRFLHNLEDNLIKAAEIERRVDGRIAIDRLPIDQCPLRVALEQGIMEVISGKRYC